MKLRVPKALQKMHTAAAYPALREDEASVSDGSHVPPSPLPPSQPHELFPGQYDQSHFPAAPEGLGRGTPPVLQLGRVADSPAGGSVAQEDAFPHAPLTHTPGGSAPTEETMDHFDPYTTGSFPLGSPARYNPPSLACMPEARVALSTPGELLTWIPSAKDEAGHLARPTTHDRSPKTESTLPLELFDDPELEPGYPAAMLAAPQDEAGALITSVAARSRYFFSGGQFTWAACWVLEYSPVRLSPRGGIDRRRWVCLSVHHKPARVRSHPLER
jgi:hypothetical protein